MAVVTDDKYVLRSGLGTHDMLTIELTDESMILTADEENRKGYRQVLIADRSEAKELHEWLGRKLAELE